MTMNTFNTIFSASNALCKWLKLALPRLPSLDGQQVGVQTLVTDAETVSWQCHVMFTDSWRERATVIVVEAHSRFVLLLPFDAVPSPAELEQAICEQWANELVSLMLKHGELGREQIPRVFTQFDQRVQDIRWYRNMDLSVHGHVGDAEQRVTQTLTGRGLDALDDELAGELAWHINSQVKHAKDNLGKKRAFYPVPLFVEEGLSKFARKLGHDDEVNNPYDNDAIKTDNVVSFMDYKANNEI